MAYTPTDVMQALQQRNLGRLRLMVKSQPDLARAQVAGMSALMLASYLRYSDAIRFLLDSGALATIHEAAVLGDADFVEQILAGDANAAQGVSHDGFTPLHLAAHFGSLDVMNALVSRGASVAAVSQNPMANTPLHGAAASDQREAASLLVSLGHPVDARDAGGNTPLMIASAGGQRDCAALLLDLGADLGAHNKAGQTALALAEGRGHRDIAKLLRTHASG